MFLTQQFPKNVKVSKRFLLNEIYKKNRNTLYDIVADILSRWKFEKKISNLREITYNLKSLDGVCSQSFPFYSVVMERAKYFRMSQKSLEDVEA